MKFIISSEHFLNTIQPLVSIINTNPALPIVENILIELNANTLTVKATDLETTIINTTKVESQDNDSIAINAIQRLDTICITCHHLNAGVSLPRLFCMPLVCTTSRGPWTAGF